MKLALEQIDFKAGRRSLVAFHRKDSAFLPFWHYHPELELTLITKGRGTRYVGDSIVNYQANDLVLIGENVPHHWVSHQDQPIHSQEAYVIQFPKDLFSRFPECASFVTIFREANRGLHFSDPPMNLLFHIQALVALKPLQQIAGLLTILEALQTTKRSPLASEGFRVRFQSAGRQNKIAQTTNYILEHLDQKLTVTDMAKFTHMVPQSFCRWFKVHIGHSFISFLNQSRIQQACHLLHQTSLPVKEIAFQCGFETVPHFNRVFRQLVGSNPSKFRKEKQ
ncbi:MAG: AraC family transcriptional regulator [Bacteroidota bacterium]